MTTRHKRGRRQQGGARCQQVGIDAPTSSGSAHESSTSGAKQAPSGGAAITYEKTVTIDDLLHIAGEMWRYTQDQVRRRGIKFGDAAAAQELLGEVQRLQPEFCKSYPVVTRYICEMQEYSARAFRRWLTKISARPWRSEEEYLDAQADYVTMLFRVKRPHANRTEVNNVYRNVRAILGQEHAAFKTTVEEHSAAIDKETTVRADKNAHELVEFLGVAGHVGMAPAGTVRVEVDAVPPPIEMPVDIPSEPVDMLAVIGEITAMDLLS